MSKKLVRAMLLLCLTAAMGTALLLHATSQGIGILNDSVKYFEAARNLEKGRGLYYVWLSGEFTREPRPLTVWPPLYPAMLAGLGACGADQAAAARAVSVCFFAANIMLVGIMIFLCTGGAAWISAMGSVLALTSVLLLIHANALSDPPFLFFSFLGMCLLAAHVERPNIRLLLGASAVVGLAFLTRYVGITLVGAGVLSLLLWRRAPLSRRVGDAAIFALVSVVPVGLWIVRNIVIEGTGTGRGLGYHPIGSDQLMVGISAVASWFFRPRVEGLSPLIVFAAGCAAVAVLAVLAARKKETAAGSEPDAVHLRYLPRLLVTFICVYVPFLLVSISFADAFTPLYDRTLAPALMAGFVLVPWMAHRIIRSMKRPLFARIVFLALGLALALSYAAPNIRWADGAHRLGKGYASKKFRQSKIIPIVRTLPPDAPLHTNAPELIRFWTGRLAVLLPYRRQIVGGRFSRGDYPDYPRQIGYLKTELRRDHGFVVLFSDAAFDARAGMPSEKELTQDLPLRLVVRAKDGAIYTLD